MFNARVLKEEDDQELVSWWTWWRFPLLCRNYCLTMEPAELCFQKMVLISARDSYTIPIQKCAGLSLLCRIQTIANRIEKKL